MIIGMILMGACSALGISNQEALSEDLETDHFLNLAIQRPTCEYHHRFRSGLITIMHYLSEHGIKVVERV